ncbi:MAG TPA: DUF5320 domain-containing protein [Clostridia bacterium]|nr:DUF5320 domain-containing protein [Clostridia bacterium]
MGLGPMTGRGLGICAGIYTGIAALRYINRGIGCEMGFGRGRGFRRIPYVNGMQGWGYPGYAAYNATFRSAADEKDYLNNQAELLQNQLQQVEKRLKEINGDTE